MFLRTSQTIVSKYFPKMTKMLTTRKVLQNFYSSAVKTENQITFKYTDEEKNKILNLLNVASTQDLQKYDISKTKLNKVEAYKLKHGKFKNVNDILKVDTFSMTIADKFFKSLLGKSPAKKTTRKPSPFVIPLLKDDQIHEIKTCVSVNIGVSNIIWSRLELQKDELCKLTHWDRHDITDEKLHIHSLIDRCLYVDHLIPQADCYVFETPQIAQSSTPENADKININIQRAQLIAIISYALASRNKSKDRSKPNVFYMKRFLAAKLFQQKIGNERISAEKAIADLMKTYYVIEEGENGQKVRDESIARTGHKSHIVFSNNFRDMYKKVEKYTREYLGQTLLLNLAFVKLVLLQDKTAMASVVPSPKPVVSVPLK